MDILSENKKHWKNCILVILRGTKATVERFELWSFCDEQEKMSKNLNYGTFARNREKKRFVSFNYSVLRRELNLSQ